MHDSRLDRVAIVGAEGQLGSELVRAFGRRAIPLGHREVEIEDPATISAALRRHRPAFLISTAAFHDVTACEQHPARAFAVNATGTENLAAACSLAGIRFAYVSTDYVFDGALGRAYREEDRPNPLQVYGISKLAGERLAMRFDGNYVFRTSGLYGSGGGRTKRSFVERILNQAKRGEPIRVVDDVTFSPSYAPHVAEHIRAILQKAPPGIYHVTNSGSCSWYDFAAAALRVAGYRQTIARASQSAFDTTVRRPANSSLDHEASRHAHVAEPSPWIEGLAAYVASADLGIESGSGA